MADTSPESITVSEVNETPALVMPPVYPPEYWEAKEKENNKKYTRQMALTQAVELFKELAPLGSDGIGVADIVVGIAKKFEEYLEPQDDVPETPGD